MLRHLPRQTRNFVPQYLAVAMMAMSPEEFGFEGITPAPALEFDVVKIDDCVDLTVLAKAAETEVETMRELNPELLRWCTPPGYKGYALRIPIGKTKIFATNYAQIPDDKKRDWVVHKVRRGETLSGISKKYRVSLGLVAETNKIRNKHRISTGQTLIIPVPAGTVQYAARSKKAAPRSRTKGRRLQTKRPTPKPDSYAGKVKVTYRIRRGDTIGHIAEWFDSRASQIRMWNDIPYGSIIRENEQLVIWVPERKRSDYEKLNDLSFEEKQRLKLREAAEQQSNASKSRSGHWVNYKVRWGDTLSEIAVLFGSTVGDLRLWNGLRSSRIYAGQTLLVAVGEKEPNDNPATMGAERSERSYVHHKIRKGESLYTIARLYDVSIREVRDWNQLKSSRIYAGQELRIYIVRGSDRSTNALPQPGRKDKATF